MSKKVTKKKEVKKSEVRGGIAQHATGWTDSDFDDESQVERVRDSQQRDYYRRLFAWEDPAAEADRVASYKFLHHVVDEGGEGGDASTRASLRAVAALNSATGGEIPEADRRDVWNHLAKHLRDAGMEPPPLGTAETNEGLRRAFKMDELRVDGEGERPVIKGHAAVFNSLSVEMMGFRETIAPGAFAKTIKESALATVG